MALRALLPRQCGASLQSAAVRCMPEAVACARLLPVATPSLECDRHCD